MLIQDTIFYRPDWRWHNFLKYLTINLSKYNCLEKIIPSEYSYKDSTYGSKKLKKNVNLKYQKRRAGDISVVYSNTKKFKRLFRWKPKYNNIRMIIQSAINWEKKLIKN